jgi:hypothetical protein
MIAINKGGRKMNLKKLHSFYILDDKNEDTLEELKKISTIQGNDKDWFEWMVLLGAFKFMNGSVLQKFLDKNELKDFNKFSSIIVKSECPDFVINECIGIEISQLIQPENAVLRKKANGLLEDNNKEGVDGFYISGENEDIAEMVNDFVSMTIRKIDRWNEYNDKFKWNFLIFNFSNTGIAVFNEHDQFKAKLEEKMEKNISICDYDVDKHYFILEKSND